MGDVIERSGLEVVECRRFDLGTTWWVVLRRGDGWVPPSVCTGGGVGAGREVGSEEGVRNVGGGELVVRRRKGEERKGSGELWREWWERER